MPDALVVVLVALVAWGLWSLTGTVLGLDAQRHPVATGLAFMLALPLLYATWESGYYWLGGLLLAALWGGYRLGRHL